MEFSPFSGPDGGLTIARSTFNNNTRGAVKVEIKTNGALDSGIRINQSVFENNTSDTLGAAVRVVNYQSNDVQTVIINESTFSHNRSTGFESDGNGGAIWLGVWVPESGSYGMGTNKLIVTKSAFNNNHAATSGGAIYADKVDLAQSTFSNNSAFINGGSIYANSVLAAQSTFSKNTAGIPSGTSFAQSTGGVGGAIYVWNSFSGHNLSLVDNNASIAGAALFFGGSSPNRAQISNSLILSNFAFVENCNDNGANYAGIMNLSWRGGSLEMCGGQALLVNLDGVTGVANFVGPLADNGGPTKTHALVSNSPAIGIAGHAKTLDFSSGNAIVVDATTDQRGLTLNVPRYDIGAYQSSADVLNFNSTHADVTKRAENGVTLTTINGQVVSNAQDIGKTAAVFVFTNITGTDNWLLLNPVTGWHPWVDCTSTSFPYAFGAMPSATDIALFYNADLSAFSGWPVLFGYGVGDSKEAACADMFSNGRYQHVTTL